jgi:leader peptidase (prepilin peptidase)/N-methyltransferase
VTAFALVVAGVYGLVVGSFLNAWAWRLARGEAITRGRSHCARCGAPVRPRDNVPLLSWLLLRGRCRDCGERISWRYPLGETVTAVLFVAVVAVDGVSWLLVPHLVFVSVMVLVSEVDLDIRIIPDKVILPAAAIGLVLMIVVGEGPWWVWPLAGIGAAGFLWLVREVYYRVRHVEGMGFGDVKMALCMGVYLGAAVVPALFVGFISGAVVGSLSLGLSRKGRSEPIPFGPFLAAGGVLALLAGQALIDWYLGIALPDD